MNHPSFRDQFLVHLLRRVNESRIRLHQLWQKIWQNNRTVSEDATQDTALIFLEKYHSLLFPEQTFCTQTEDSKLDPLKLKTTELILKKVNLYYLPYRLESLLPYCDPFTAVGTFLNALNLSYQSLIQNLEQQKIGQAIIKQLMEIEQDYNLKSTEINEFPLYESASTHNLNKFHNTALTLKRALDVINLLDRVKPPRYQKQKDHLLQYWHQQKLHQLEKTITKLTQ
jgi:hypothetical protein